jgi:hypothetical protein
VLGGPTLNVADLVGKAKTLAVHHTFARSTFDPVATLPGFCGVGHGIIHPAVRLTGGVRLSLLRPHRHSRLSNRSVTARPSGALLPTGRRRSGDHTGGYQSWVEAFARNHRTPIRWAEKGVRKEDYVLPWLRRMVKKDAYGVYFIFKSMEVGPTFRITVPKYPTKDPNYRILANQWSRFTHYYFYIHDEVLGPIVMRVAFFPRQNHLLPQRPQLHRAPAQTRRDRLPQERRRFCGS